MTNSTNIYDIAIVGAGLAGLTCAQHLQQQRYKVIVVDKSRGVGGRVATRRINKTCVDHGLSFLEIQGKQTEELIQQLTQANILKLWDGKIYQLDSQNNLKPTPPIKSYIVPQGINTIAKYLARGLEVKRQFQVTAIKSIENIWQILTESNQEIKAKAIVMAIPAPQTLPILESQVPTKLINQLRQVQFYPCITMMAGYDSQYLSDLPSWHGVKINNQTDLIWITLDSSKRDTMTQPVFVFHSTPEFAQKYLDVTDLQSAAKQLLQQAASLFLPWLDSPQWLQVHRWRYSIPSHSLSLPCLSTTQPLPLVCCGDWCNGNRVEDALISGLASADRISGLI
ncbi:FAD dependent oxidoreductase [Stanieria cyanosphaera PCC 7437]|uniref:FAD dependent oxidoreductase n=1 Tax=Stanieria cyanosphaera (strain ATCC 29371 / PCC 7437) TaxID=111780 RepID=K9XWA2_STAC7|nr:FAD-dependent oxidoreductase [Stanieria cyanosphaera]AFZ35947.1 FAD dependent oxidoreductase [Stanieria cyanosphaera PCC 7437]